MAQFTQRESGTANDGYKAGSWFPDGGWCIIGWNTFSSSENYSGARFTNVSIDQGTIIDSAFVTLTAYQTDTDTVDVRFECIDEDDAGDLTSDPSGRSVTTANTTHNFTGITNNTEYVIDITTAVQEVINRAGWVPGNDLIVMFRLNSGSGTNRIIHFHSEASSSTKSPYIEINWSGTTTSTSTTTTTSSSTSSSTTTSTTTLPLEFIGMKVSKPGIDVLKTNMPNDLIFSSNWNTLKYFMEGRMSVRLNATIDALTAETVTTEIYHNLNYFPFHIAYISTSLTGFYYPQASVEFGSGAGTYITTFATQQKLILSLTIDNFEVVPTAYDITAYCFYKIYKNNLNL